MIRSRITRLLGTVSVLGGSLYLITQVGLLSQQGPPPTLNRFAGPTSSQTLALDANGTLLAVANPDNNSVTFFDVTANANRRLREVQVGREPWGVALNPQGTRAYVANTVSGTVSVLSIARNSPQVARLLTEIPVGTEPYGICLTPNGSKLYVTNRNSNTVSVIDTRTNRVVNVVTDIGFSPRGIAITNNGDGNDDDETILITQFFGVPNPGQLDGEDDAKSGLVTVLRTVNDGIDTTVKLLPLGDTGFQSAGSALEKVAAPQLVTTGAYPNQLNNVVIKGNYAYVPSVGASPNGPVLFDVNTQSLLSVIDMTAKTDAQKTINMHAAVRDQAATPKRFLTVPIAAAAKYNADEMYVVASASDVVVKLSVDRGTGKPTVISNGSPSRTLQIPTGKNPRGIVVNNTDTRAYVMNYITRDVTVINTSSDTVVTTMQSANMPAPGSFEDQVHAGKELYNSSIGEFDPPTGFGNKITGRMSRNGWGSCSSCHPEGLSDNVVWIFAAGPRRTISQHVDFDPDDPTKMRPLNWTANRDEQEDFELNIRDVSGGDGILVGDDGTSQLLPATNFTPPNAGRRQLKIRGFGGWDAIKAYIQFGIRAPISPVSKDEPDVIAGEALFRQANCQSCHGGTMWTNARVRHTGQPAADLVPGGEIIGELRKVGTFDPTQKNELRANGTASAGVNGFVTPSLMSIFAFPNTFLHNGQADSLDQVVNNVAHRTSGTQGRDTLIDETSRRQLVRFLLSIDASSAPIDPQ